MAGWRFKFNFITLCNSDNDFFIHKNKTYRIGLQYTASGVEIMGSLRYSGTYYNVNSLTPFKVSVKGLFRTDSSSESFWVNRANSTANTLNTHYVSNLLVWELAQ